MPARKGGHETFCGNWENGVDKRCDERYNLSCVCGRSSSGRARPCQGRGSEFEPRRPLQKEYPIRQDGVFFLECAAAPENSLPRPARSASNPEVKAGLPRMALPFVGCREASSSLVYFAAQSTKNKETPSDRMVFLFGMPRAGWNSLPRPARSASNRSVGDGVPDVPSARRCRAGNGFPRRFAPRSKCPWGTPRNDRGGVYRHAANIRQDGVSFLTAPGETPASGRAAPPAPRRSAPAVRPGRR